MHSIPLINTPHYGNLAENREYENKAICPGRNPSPMGILIFSLVLRVCFDLVLLAIAASARKNPCLV